MRARLRATVRARREQLGLSQAMAAMRVGLTQSDLAHLEDPSDPKGVSLERLICVLHLLGCRVDVTVRGVD